MRYLIVSLAAVFLFAVEASAQSPSGNSLDKPAQRSGVRSHTWSRPESTEPPPASSGGKEMEATTAPKVGLETWVVRERVYKSNFDTGKPNLWLNFYRVEKAAALTHGTLNQRGGAAVPRPKQPWSMTREDTHTLAQHLFKFVEWSDVAEKNRVQEVHKEIGQLPSHVQTFWFHREKEAGPSKSWLIVTSFNSTQIYRLSAADAAALLELLDKLPGLEDQLLERNAPPPNKGTDALFK